jgi:hypothetical protein
MNEQSATEAYTYDKIAIQTAIDAANVASQNASQLGKSAREAFDKFTAARAIAAEEIKELGLCVDKALDVEAPCQMQQSQRWRQTSRCDVRVSGSKCTPLQGSLASHQPIWQSNQPYGSMNDAAAVHSHMLGIFSEIHKRYGVRYSESLLGVEMDQM